MENKRTLKSILFVGSMASTRLWLAMGSITWALLLLWPGQLFGPSRTTYSLMSHVAPEEAWGAAFFVHGIWAIYTLVTGTKNHVSLAMDALLGCILWTSSTLLCFSAYWPSVDKPLIDKIFIYPMPAAMSGELWMSIASWWHLVRYWAEERDE